ncbi:hypothetical protein Gasu2_61680 [Galdieria sulphuraria]|uniref:Uncharacterized protein n=1 Tax=Galdieria sulphuraria TaxID=130081 RepID=M2XXH0_GALSU|nr:uncharacterized protein Gasu_43020 [Galdieria sulphuraria]EME28134.1 hypothetical protein Gasu_43020 [Galdieria sulphuraria]GJD12057.1 hypothetical protein Gasu2_61680 [Galdieria sulphuraria]|eukprot:XP_005704654.1 hypothetical protein Gasu_43020 [Galdieria sulphuraria]
MIIGSKTLHAEELEQELTTEPRIPTTEELESQLAAKQKQLDLLKSEMDKAKKETEKTKQDLNKQARTLQDKNEEILAQLDKKNKEALQLQEELAKVQEQLFEVQKMVENPHLSQWLRSKAEFLKTYVDPYLLEAIENTKNQLSSTNYLSTQVVDHLRDNLEMKLQKTPVKKFSPIMAGILSYGVVLVPLGLSFYGIFRLSSRISLKHYILIGSLVIATLHIFFALISLFTRQDALTYLQQANENNFIFLQLIMGVLYIAYCGLLIVGLSSTENRRDLFMLLIIFLCYFMLGLYYREIVWRPTMRKDIIRSSIWSHLTCSLFTTMLLVALASVLKSYKQGERHIATSIRDLENGFFNKEARKGDKIQ